MLSFVRKLRNDDRGYDLLQMMIVAVLIGALLAIASVSLLDQVEKGKRTAVQQSVRNAITSTAAYQSQHGSLVAWADGIESAVQDDVGATSDDSITIKENGYYMLIVVNRGGIVGMAQVDLFGNVDYSGNAYV